MPNLADSKTLLTSFICVKLAAQTFLEPQRKFLMKHLSKSRLQKGLRRRLMDRKMKTALTDLSPLIQIWKKTG